MDAPQMSSNRRASAMAAHRRVRAPVTQPVCDRRLAMEAVEANHR
jgi:hypothetical protein